MNYKKYRVRMKNKKKIKLNLFTKEEVEFLNYIFIVYKNTP